MGRGAMDESEVLRRAMDAGRSKRSTDKTKSLRSQERDWKAVLPKGMENKDYCKLCTYPLRFDGGCTYCEDERKRDTEQVKSWSTMIGGQRAWRTYTDSNFVRTAYNTSAYNAAKSFDPRRQSLLFHGPSGTGKSHLASIAKRQLILRGERVLTVSMPDVIDEMIANIKSNRFGNEWIGRLISAPILSIEDVGAGEKISEFIVKLYFRVIDGRYVAGRQGLIVTTNYSLEELKSKWHRFDEPGRVVSRLKEMCIILSLVGERDWRVP
jgi:DNA replication protein DnaC